MPDKKISELDTATIATGDYVPFVDDPGGSPVTKKFEWPQGLETSDSPTFAEIILTKASAQASVTLIRTGDINQEWELGRVGPTGNFTIKDNTNDKIPVTIIPASPDDVLKIDTAQTTFNDDQLDYDFRFKGNGSNKLLFLDAGTDRIGIRNAAPAAELHIDQESTTGAIPALLLDQADIDVVLLKVIGSADAASADRTLVADSDYGTPGALVGWIQVEIQDDGNRVADGDYYIPFYAVPT